MQRKTIPPGVEAAVFTALEKLPADRFGTAAEFAAALANPTTTTARTSVQPAVAAVTRRNWVAAGALAVLALVAGFLIGGRKGNVGSVGPNEVVKASLALGDSAVIRSISNARLAIAPSGRRIAFVGADGTDNSLWVREIDQPAARKLPDTKGAFAPFFSPDGESIGFFTTAGGGTAIKVIPVAGGVARTVVPDSVAPFGGGDWGDDDQIVYTHINRGLARVASTGGAITHISHPDSASGVQEHDYPDVLPGSKSALVMLWLGSIGSNHIGLVDLKTGAVTDLTAGSYARYAAPGYLAIGASDGRILAAPFDVRRGKLGGTPVLMLDDVQAEATNGTVQFAVSQTGVLVYEPESGGSGGLVWVDRAGKRTPIDTTLKQVGLDVALSPDASEIALTRSESGDNQIWVKQLATGTLSRLSFDVENADRAVWTPDGRRVAFLATRNNRRTAWIRRADGSDSAVAAYPGSHGSGRDRLRPADAVHPAPVAGQRFGDPPPVRGQEWRRHRSAAAGAVPVRQLRHDALAGRAVAGLRVAGVRQSRGLRPAVPRRGFGALRDFRRGRPGAGVEPRRARTLLPEPPRRDVRRAGHHRAGLHARRPEAAVHRHRLRLQDYHRSYDVHPDGKRFLMVAAGGGDANSVNVIFNWRVELEKLKKAAK